MLANIEEGVSRGRGRPKASQRTMDVQRYQLVLPTDFYSEIRVIADAEHASVLDTIRRLIRYGLTIFKILKDRDAQLIIREGDVERVIVFS